MEFTLQQVNTIKKFQQRWENGEFLSFDNLLEAMEEFCSEYYPPDEVNAMLAELNY